MISDWMQCQLGELFDFKNGLNAEKAAYGDGVPFVNVMDVFGNDILTAEKIRGKMQATAKQMEDYSVKRGDVLFNRTSETFDEIAMSAVYLDDQPAVFGGFVIRARPRDRRLNPHFCAYYFQSGSFRKELIRRGQGAVRANIGQKDLAVVPAIVPTLPEQRRIAEILSTWDRAIEATEKLIANSEAQKKALMQQLLTGKKRLPGFHGEWTKTTLGDLGAVSSAGVDKKVVEGEQSVRLLNFLDAYHKEFVFNCDLGHEVTAPSSKVSQCNVKKGDVFFTPSSETRDDIGLCAVAAEDMPGVVYSYHVVRLRPKQKLDLYFSAYIFQTDKFKRQTYRMGDGSGQRYVISQSNFRKMEIDIPPLAEQQAIGSILAECSRQIGKQRNDLERLKREKAALMQQLLTGKRRVAINKEEAA